MHLLNFRIIVELQTFCCFIVAFPRPPWCLTLLNWYWRKVSVYKIQWWCLTTVFCLPIPFARIGLQTITNMNLKSYFERVITKTTLYRPIILKMTMKTMSTKTSRKRENYIIMKKKRIIIPPKITAVVTGISLFISTISVSNSL